ncbi:molybdopterin molybdotransferase MoeA [Aureimonas fodinaquatilis]|uniref:Molybdopterin molybdenumtransferase n=1 Tax=Aureimonas fodinaquatilis TaxID=2565783 RepID=A0A5B0DVN6_9HYPH|nr:molybdopterin molybdotransferase MoeA [Aureimonas fodinaquatilis]KAA0970483.1 molybdopterin molybdotransferase MoeA [Aureimonas fodinaquatilis]
MSLLPFEAALERLLAGASAIQRTESLPLRQASGRILAADLPALRTHPPFNSSAMDGYALRAEDAKAGKILQIAGVSAAGGAQLPELPQGQCIRIFTGAPVPQAADTVLIQENTELLQEQNAIRVVASAEPNQNIRPTGGDFAKGQRLLMAGNRLSAGAIALAASGGHDQLTVLAKPVVAILATGDELVQPGGITSASQIIASNSYGIAALVEANGGTVLDLGICGDTLEAAGDKIDLAILNKADILVTIGGASVGDRDLVAPALQSRGVVLDFWKIAMRPGKPFMAGSRGAMRCLGLPGNPASAMVTATVFLRPLLRRMAGLPLQPLQAGKLAKDVGQGGLRAEFMRARLLEPQDGGPPLVEPLARQDSSLLSIYAAANALLLRPVNAPPGKADDNCLFFHLD